MIIEAKDATHEHCLECDNEEPLGGYAETYDETADCSSCGAPCTELLLIRDTPLRSEDEDEDMKRDRRCLPGGKIQWVYYVNGEPVGGE